MVCVGAGAGERMAGAKVPSLSPQSQGGPGSNKSDCVSDYKLGNNANRLQIQNRINADKQTNIVQVKYLFKNSTNLE